MFWRWRAPHLTSQEFGDDMDASFSAVQKTLSLVNVASEHYENVMGANKEQPRLASFPSVIRGYVEALTKSCQQFRIPQELPIGKVNRLYAKCGQAHENGLKTRDPKLVLWSSRRSSVHRWAS